MHKQFFTACLVLALALISCTKDDPEDAAPKENWEQITNLKIPDEFIESWEGKELHENVWLFNLDDGVAVPNEHYKSDKWDFGFYACGGKDIVVNNRQGWTSFQKGVEGNVLAALLPLSFMDVTEAPDPEVEGSYNTATYPNGERREDREPNQIFLFTNEISSIIGYYAAVNEGRNYRRERILPNRTFVFRTNRGNYAKLQMQGIYKDSPARPTWDDEPHYLTFRYFVQRDGSRNLDNRN